MLEDAVESELVDRLMFQDDLTGLVVKRRFNNDLAHRIQTAGAQGVSLSVFMMDMDGLKKVNDTHGHPTGAFVISETGKIIGDLFNAVGQACRFGGDEFIAYLLNASKAEALKLGESIRQAIQGHVFVKENVELRVTISIGVAAFPENGRSLEALVQAADKALYRAKGKGRNAVSD
jgi:diguanylate cyclase (GGDEF)-like protein